MRPLAYIEMLENSILCLLAEREAGGKGEFDNVPCAPDVTDPCFVGSTLSPYNLRTAIEQHRGDRLAKNIQEFVASQPPEGRPARSHVVRNEIVDVGGTK